MAIARLSGDLPDPLRHHQHLVGPLGLRQEDEVGSLGHHRLQILQAQRKLVDPHHALGADEVDAAQSVPHQQAGRVLLGRVDGVLQIEDHAVRPVNAGVDHELGLATGQVETRAPQPVPGTGSATGYRPLGPRVAFRLGAGAEGGRLYTGRDGEGESSLVVDRDPSV